MQTYALSKDRRSLLTGSHIKFRCRLASADGADTQRDFTGVYYPRWRALYLDEVRYIRHKVYQFPVYEFEVLTKADGDHYFATDFKEGEVLTFGSSQKGRDHVPRRFVITHVDKSNCHTEHKGMSRGTRTHISLSNGAQMLLERLRDGFIQRSGSVELGIKDAGRLFRHLDFSGERKLDPNEFRRACDVAGISQADYTPRDVDDLFEAFDRDSDGFISYEEFMNVFRGPMSERRKSLVQKAFRLVDYDNDGVISVHDLRVKYNANMHPDVLSGALTEAEALKGFIMTWDTQQPNGQITFAEFSDFYNGISAVVEDDEEFERIIRRSWSVL